MKYNLKCKWHFLQSPISSLTIPGGDRGETFLPVVKITCLDICSNQQRQKTVFASNVLASDWDQGAAGWRI